MHCRICGRQDARIPLCELEIARITHRAHVDCFGHSEYRLVTFVEVDAAIAEHAQEREEEEGHETQPPDTIGIGGIRA